MPLFKLLPVYFLVNFDLDTNICQSRKFQTSLFHVDYSMKWTFVELIPFACLGLFGGTIGSLFIW